MSEYYGVSPSSDFFAHYGVKGMKWGIRRALRSSDPSKLSKQYQKAVKNLVKMSIKANNTVNETKYQKWRQQARKNAVFEALGGGLGGGIGAMHGVANAGAKYGLTLAETLSAAPQLKVMGAQFAGAGALAGGIGGYTGARLRAHIYKRRQNPEVRNKLIAKRDLWKKDMEDAFNGTRYGGKAQKKFHNEISKLSNVSDPKGYIQKQRDRASRDLQNYQKSTNMKKRRR